MQTVETLNQGLKRAYRITIAAKDIDALVDKELKSIAPQARMPGFRPGKVPANLLRRMHGPQLEQQALENAVQDGVQQLMTEQKIRPAMQPTVALEEGGPGKDAVVTVEVETLPDVPEANIAGLKIERLSVEPDRRGDRRRRWRASPRARRATIRRPPSTKRRWATSSSWISRARSTASRSTAARARACRSSSARAG